MKHRLPLVAKLLSKTFVVSVAVVTAGMFITCMAPVPFGGDGGNGDNGGAPDTTPPANVTDITAGVTVTEGSNGDTVDVTLNWTNPPDSDFSHVEITWTPSAPDAPEIVRNAVTYTAVALPAMEDGALVTYTFTIISVDTSGNKLDTTAGETGATKSVTTDTTPPASIDSDTITGRITAGDGILRWANPVDDDFSHVEITWTPNAPAAPVRVPEAGVDMHAVEASYVIMGFTGTEDYTFTLVAVDTNHNRSAGTDFTITPTDGTGPDAVDNLTAMVTNAATGDVIVNWSNPDDFSYVEITWTPDAPDSPVSVLATDPNPGSATITITNYDDARDYMFTVTAFDADDNSSPVAVFVLDQTAPGPVTSLNAMIDSGTATLTWENPLDDDFARVEISWTSSGTTMGTPAVQPLAIIADDNGDIATTTDGITGLSDSETYTFSVVSVDTNENVSVAEIFVLDQTAPGPVTSLNAMIDSGTATLTWTDPTDDDLARVEISWTSSGSTLGSPATQPVRVDVGVQTTDGITGLSDSETYTFSAVSVDGNGNASVPVTFELDQIPPAPVTALSATIAGSGTATLNWTNPMDAATFTQVNITWAPNTAAGEPLEITDGAETATIDGFTGGIAYTFTVVALDDAGNESTEATDTDTGPVSVPEVTDLAGELAANGVVNLEWTYPGADDFSVSSLSHADVRWTTADGSVDQTRRVPALGDTAMVGSTGTTSITGLIDGTEYTITVTVEDADRNMSNGITIMRTADAAAQPITLNLTALQNGGARLTWTNPTDPSYTPDGSGPDPSKIVISRSDGSNPINVADGTTQVDVTDNFTLGDTVSFTAKVTDNLGHESSVSMPANHRPVQGRVAIFTLGKHDGDFGFAACQTALDNTTGNDGISAIASELRSDGYTKAILFGSTSDYSAGQLADDEDAFQSILAGVDASGGPYGLTNRYGRRVTAYTYDGTSVVETATYDEGTYTAEATLGGLTNVSNGAWKPTNATQTHTGTVQILTQLGIDTNEYFWSFTNVARGYHANNCMGAADARNTTGRVGGRTGITQADAGCSAEHYVVCIAH